MIEPPPPPINPVIYIAVFASFLCALVGIVSAVTRGRSEREAINSIMTEVYRVTRAIQNEGRVTRHLLVRIDRRRRKAIAREAELRLRLGRDADGPISVQRVIDGEAGGAER